MQELNVRSDKGAFVYSSHIISRLWTETLYVWIWWHQHKEQ